MPLMSGSGFGGKVLLVGVTHKANTLLHLAESIAGMPYVRLPYDASWGPDVQVAQRDGTVVRYAQREFPGCSSRFGLIADSLQQNGLVRHGKLGGADTQLMDAAGLVDTAVALLRQNNGLFLCTDESCPCCPARRALLAELGRPG